MKKLLFVLLIVALASYLFVGCMPVTPSEGEGEGEGEVGICPAVTISSQQAVGGKTYVKAGSQTITVTFAVPTEPVSVYVANILKTVPEATAEVVMYANADKTVYTGTVLFAGTCDEGYIYVETCDSCAPCKYPYKVDGVGPASEIKIASAACVCEGVTLTFKEPTQTTTCGVTGVCCGDACSGFASYAIDLYTKDPFNACCDIPCVTPAYSCPGGVACPIDCELSCIVGGVAAVPNGAAAINKTYYAVATLLDNVGNRTRYYAKIVLDTDSIVSVHEFYNATGLLCTDFVGVGTDVTATSTAGVVSGTIGLCK